MWARLRQTEIVQSVGEFGTALHHALFSERARQIKQRLRQIRCPLTHLLTSREEELLLEPKDSLFRKSQS